MIDFLVDAQLPRRVARLLASAGGDVVHTLDLPEGNRTSDTQITRIADEQPRVVVTKDGDFVDSHLLRSCPAKLLLISTGNISNAELEALMMPLLDVILDKFETSDFLEVDTWGVVIRG